MINKKMESDAIAKKTSVSVAKIAAKKASKPTEVQAAKK